MTEQEWLASTDPAKMLETIQDGYPLQRPDSYFYSAKISDRKLRLFCAECFHIVFGHRLGVLSPWSMWQEGEQGESGLSALDEATSWVSNPSDTHVSKRSLMAAILRDIVGSPWKPVPSLRKYQQQRMNLTGAVVNVPCWQSPWLTSTVLAIAGDIYDRRAFDECGVLADALEDAGCDDEAILRHLRGEEKCRECNKGIEFQKYGAWFEDKVKCRTCNGTGWRPRTVGCVRGCHVIDAILGKS